MWPPEIYHVHSKQIKSDKPMNEVDVVYVWTCQGVVVAEYMYKMFVITSKRIFLNILNIYTFYAVNSFFTIGNVLFLF